MQVANDNWSRFANLRPTYTASTRRLLARLGIEEILPSWGRGNRRHYPLGDAVVAEVAPKGEVYLFDVSFGYDG